MMTAINGRVGDNARTIAFMLRRTLKEVVAHVGWSEQSMYERFRGRTRIGIDELIPLAEILETTPENLLKEEPELPPRRSK